MFCLACYDCSDDKRRLKVSKILLDYGYRVQYSVFEVKLNRKLFDEMHSRILKVISKRDDSIRIYHLCDKCLKQTDLDGDCELTNQELVFVI